MVNIILSKGGGLFVKHSTHELLTNSSALNFTVE